MDDTRRSRNRGPRIPTRSRYLITLYSLDAAMVVARLEESGRKRMRISRSGSRSRPWRTILMLHGELPGTTVLQCETDLSLVGSALLIQRIS